MKSRLAQAPEPFNTLPVNHAGANRALDLTVRQACLAGFLALALSSNGWAAQGASPPASSPSSSHDQFSGVLRFLAPQPHAASQHPHPNVATSRTAPPTQPHRIASATRTAPVARAAPIYRTAAARSYPPAGRLGEPRLVSPAAYIAYAYPRYAYPRYAYPVVAWQAYGYRVFRYVYYYPYPGGYSGY